MKKQSLLWQIKPKTGDGPVSYLFGTMHVRDPRAFGRLPLAQRHLDACEVFAAEYDLDDDAHLDMQELNRLPDELPLSAWIKPSLWKRIVRTARPLGIGEHALQWQHPLALQTLFLETMMQETAPYSVDDTLWRYAREQGKTCTGIETLGEQITVLRQMPFEYFLKSLTDLMSNVSRYRRQLNKMIDWYASEQIDKLYQAARRSARDMRGPVLFNRNRNMAERIAEIARTQPLFCAVGAGHLAGKEGVLRLLKHAGFHVAPIRTP